MTVLPFPAGTDGLAICVPGIGPVQRFDRRLQGEWAEWTRAGLAA